MATIQIPVKVLDEKCTTCKAMYLTKQELYADANTFFTEYTCSNLHLCTYIRNRIVRNENESEENLNNGSSEQ